jgi:hypothetical protein
MATNGASSLADTKRLLPNEKDAVGAWSSITPIMVVNCAAWWPVGVLAWAFADDVTHLKAGSMADGRGL